MKESLQTLLSPSDAENGFVGRLHLETEDGVEVNLFIMNGQIVAAHAEDDRETLTRLLQRHNALTSDLSEVLARSNGANAIYEVVASEVPEVIGHEILYERFKQNVGRFLESEGDGSFTPMDAVIVPNIHLTHCSQALLRELSTLLQRTAKLRETQMELRIKVGERRIIHEPEREIASLFTTPNSLSSVLNNSPYEPLQTIDIVNDMLTSGSLVFASGVEKETRTHGSFEAPRYSKKDALEAINLSASSIKMIADAVENESIGQGRAILRLNLDGGPSRFAALFHGLPISDENFLDDQELFARLRQHDASQRRDLLNLGLSNLIDRTLSSADAQLSDDDMEALLQALSQ